MLRGLSEGLHGIEHNAPRLALRSVGRRGRWSEFISLLPQRARPRPMREEVSGVMRRYNKTLGYIYGNLICRARYRKYENLGEDFMSLCLTYVPLCEYTLP